MKKEVMATGTFLSMIKLDGYEMVERVNCAGVVVIIAVTPEAKLVLVEQFRPALQKYVVELPAGLVGDVVSARGESFESAAHRELEEETGYRAETLERLAVWPTSCGMTSETVTVFRARGLKRVGSGGGDDSERIAVHEIALSNIHAWLDDRIHAGTMADSKVYAALSLVSRAEYSADNMRK